MGSHLNRSARQISNSGRPVRVLALALLAFGCRDVPAPNLVLVTIDTLRADHSSAYGYPRDTTPALRDLASRGTRFENAYAPQAVTGPSHATLFTGLHPLAHGVVYNGVALTSPQRTLAERLDAAGYATAAFVSSYPLKRRFGFGRGFDEYDDRFTADEATIALDEWLGTEVEGAFDRNAAATMDRALAWLAERGARSDAAPPPGGFLLWVHLFEPHTPLEPDPSVLAHFTSEPLAERHAEPFRPYVDRYDAEILFADRQLARLLAALDAAELSDSTIVAVTSDHGEGLNEHGPWLHGYSLHEGELRVPLVVRFPGQERACVVQRPVQLADLLPTLASWLPLGLDANPIAPASAAGLPLGRDPCAEDTGGADPERELHFYRFHQEPRWVQSMFPVRPDGSKSGRYPLAGDQLAIRRGPWKLLFTGQQQPLELYDLDSDPREGTNLADERAELARDLATRARAFARAHGRAAARRIEPFDPEDRRALEALGYVAP